MNIKVRENTFVYGYKSNSQRARVFSESWVSSEMYCPNCLNLKLNAYENNNKVADFYCPTCRNAFQLKAASKKIGRKIVDGEYYTLAKYLKNKSAPNFFLMQYDIENWSVNNLSIIPKFFLSLDIIEKRKPLSSFARRHGWTGCNILIHLIPDEAKIPVIQNTIILDKQSVNSKFKKYSFLENEKSSQISWISDVLFCIERLQKDNFQLKDLYHYKTYLKMLHPKNNHIEEKIRQQLQILRDKNLIEFIGRGLYRKTDHQ